MIPKTRCGKCAVAFGGLFLIAFAALHVFALSGEHGGETFIDNPKLAIAGISAALFGIASLVSSAFAIFHQRERAALVYVAGAMGLVVLIFVLGEFLCPH